MKLTEYWFGYSVQVLASDTVASDKCTYERVQIDTKNRALERLSVCNEQLCFFAFFFFLPTVVFIVMISPWENTAGWHIRDKNFYAGHDNFHFCAYCPVCIYRGVVSLEIIDWNIKTYEKVRNVISVALWVWCLPLF